MTITAAGLAGGAAVSPGTSVSLSLGSVTAGQLVVVCGVKYSPVADAFVAGDCTQSAGTATLGTISLDKANGGSDGVGAFGYSAIWSAIVTGSGTCTMQIAGGDTGAYQLIAAEAFNGSWDASRVEASNGTDSDTTSPVSTGTATSAGAALFVGAFQNNAGSASTITPSNIGGSAPATIYENESASDDNGSAVYQIVSTGTTDDAEWTSTAINAGMASLVVYKEAGAAATVDQQSFRFGADDGSESAHAWLAAQGSNVTVTPGSSFLVRMLIQASGDPAATAYTLRYQVNGTGGYIAVPVASGNVYVAASGNIAASGEATTSRLTGGTGSFTTGRRWDDENGTDTIDIAANNNTEVEWSINADQSMAGKYVEFRVYAGANALDTYTTTPRVDFRGHQVAWIKA